MPVKRTGLYLALALTLPAATGAASDADDAIAACARISSTGDRILCLEDALRRLSPAETAAAMPDADKEDLVGDEATSLSAAAGDAETELVSEPVAARDIPAVAAASVPVDADQDRSEPAGSPQTAEAAPQVELGAEQVARQNNVEEEQVRISAAIVEHTLVGTGRLRLTLDNGQVWQQTGDDDDRIARRIRGQANIAVEMWQSRSGGYRMHLLEVDRTLRVRRIR